MDVHGDFLSSGYNGPARGEAHCITVPCAGAHAAPGEGLSGCEAVHGEMNAVTQCRNPYAVHTAYCTDSPCLDCVKVLLNTSCQRIVFLRNYPHPEAQARWKKTAMQLSDGSTRFREWEHFLQADAILALDLMPHD